MRAFSLSISGIELILFLLAKLVILTPKDQRIIKGLPVRGVFLLELQEDTGTLLLGSLSVFLLEAIGEAVRDSMVLKIERLKSS